MIVGPPPLPKITDGKIEIPNPIGVTFINSGTRGASINAVGVQIDQGVGPERYNGPCPQGTFLETEFTPLVLKEKEIAVQRFKVRDDQSVPVASGSDIEKRPLRSCLWVILSTPSVTAHDIAVMMPPFQIEGEIIRVSAQEKPFRLYRRWGSIFELAARGSGGARRVAREIEARRTGVYVLSDDERAAIKEGERSGVASEEEVQKFWKRHGV